MVAQAIVRVERHRAGSRVYVLGRRCHHGTVGVAVTAAAVMVGSWPLACAGVALMANDLHDWRDWPALVTGRQPLFT